MLDNDKEVWIIVMSNELGMREFVKAFEDRKRAERYIEKIKKRDNLTFEIEPLTMNYGYDRK